MDSGDPTTLLFTKIQSFEPHYAPKIIGYLLFHDFGERDLMHLVLGPESVLKSLILKVKCQLGILSNNLPSPSSTLTSPSPLCRPPINGGVSSHTNGFMDFRRNSPSSPSLTSSWSFNNGNTSHIPPRHPPISKPLSPHQTNSVSVTDSGADAGGSADLVEDRLLSDYFSFLDDSCSETEDVLDPKIPLDYSVGNGETHLHKRSFSADASFVSRDDGTRVGSKPCVYFSRGYCKNGDGCRFIHGGYQDNIEEEMMRLKLVHQQQRFASQVRGRATQLPYEKGMDVLLQQHALRDGEQPFGDERYRGSSSRSLGRLERMDLMSMQFGDQSNSSTQIYLTFPAESTFKDEDVATYFSFFGPVQDVRIPCKENRMYGFVSFAHPETVKTVLTRGNPHFICNARVLVKPYKEKGKDKKQQIERGYFSSCSSPSGIDPRERSDFHLCSKSYERRELMRKMEQADLMRDIEFERRRVINLQLPEFKNSITQNHHRGFSVGSPGYFSSASNQTADYQSELTGADALEVVDGTSELHHYPVINGMSVNNNYSRGAEEGTSEMLETGRPIELVLPSNVFPSASSNNDHKTTDDSAKTNAKVGVSSTKGNDHKTTSHHQ